MYDRRIIKPTARQCCVDVIALRKRKHRLVKRSLLVVSSLLEPRKNYEIWFSLVLSATALFRSKKSGKLRIVIATTSIKFATNRSARDFQEPLLASEDSSTIGWLHIPLLRKNGKERIARHVPNDGRSAQYANRDIRMMRLVDGRSDH